MNYCYLHIKRKRGFSSIVVVFIVQMLLSLVISSPVDANPIPVDHDNEMMPIPYKDTSIYLSSETIDVTFNEKNAQIKASYTFTNDRLESTNLTIILPFKTEPKNLKTFIDTEPISYSWMTLLEYPNTIDINKYDHYDITELHTILIHIEFRPLASVNVIVEYERDYITYDAPELGNTEIYYNFVYITGTARYWNHSIDRADFIFRVPEEMTDGASSFYNEVKLVDGYYVTTRSYEDWTVGNDENGEIFFEWKKKRPIDFETWWVIPCIIVLTIMIILAILITKKVKGKIKI